MSTPHTGKYRILMSEDGKSYIPQAERLDICGKPWWESLCRVYTVEEAHYELTCHKRRGKVIYESST